MTTSADNVVHQGRLVLVVSDTVVLEQRSRQEWLKLGGLDRVEVQARVHSYALVGAIVGGVAGAAGGSTSTRHYCNQTYNTVTGAGRYCGVSPAVGAILYGLGGMAVGAIIGGRIKSTVWEPIPQDRLGSLRVSVAPLPSGRMGLVASLAF